MIKKILKTMSILILTSVLCLSATLIAQAGEETVRQHAIRSYGTVEYQAEGSIAPEIKIDATDFKTLAREIDSLETEYKFNVVNALKNIGTYFTSDGSITHDSALSNIDMSNSASINQLAFGKITGGILQSQSIPTQMTYIDKGGIRHPIKAAKADNLSLGTASWVDGQLLVGNGADNDSFYATGYMDGINKGQENATITYTYHTHMGSSSTNGGCYTKAVYHTHTDSCYYTCTITTGACQGGGTSDSWGVRCPVTITHSQCGAPNGSSTRYHKKSDLGGSHESASTTTHLGTLKCNQGSVIVQYNLGCGKTGSSIDSATIIFN